MWTTRVAEVWNAGVEAQMRFAFKKLAHGAPLAAVVALQFVGTMAALYLPSLNADIIDKGVVTGDTDYIMRTGGVMLAVAPRVEPIT